MARIGLSLAEVAAAFEKLLTQGSAPSAANIQSVLGKGTEAQIQKHINTLIDQSKRDLQVPLALEPMPTEAAAVRTPEPKMPVETPPSAPTPMPTPVSAETVTVTQLPPQAEPRRPQFQVKKFERRDNNKGPRNPNHSYQKNSNHNNAAGNNYHHPIQDDAAYQDQQEPVAEVALESLSAEQLIIKIRRMESILLKEQARRETAERIAIETKDYAETIKEQVAHRINDLRQSMDVALEQLKAELREQKQAYAEDLKFYDSALQKANEKLLTVA